MSLNFLRFTAIPIAVAFGHLHTHNELPTLKLLIKSAGKPTGNNPTITYEKFKTDSYKGIALFDGHGQHRMPNQMKEYIPTLIYPWFKSVENFEDPVQTDYAFKTLFDKIENTALDSYSGMQSKAVKAHSQAGTSAIITMLTDTKILVANCGMCHAMVVQESEGKLKVVDMCEIHSIQRKEERDRLRAEHPEEDDIVLQLDEDDWYIKGRIKYTRAIGALNFKHKGFNFESFYLGSSYYPRILRWSGRYITHQPSLASHTRSDKDKYLVIASSNLWARIGPDIPELISDAQNHREIGVILQQALTSFYKANQYEMLKAYPVSIDTFTLIAVIPLK